MSRVPRRILEQLRPYVAELEPARMTTDHAAEDLETLAEVERMVAGARILLARRAAEGRAWARAGHRSPAAWLAEVTGTGFGEAVRTLETADLLEELPDTADALRQGRLSQAQATEIASAANADPSAEAALIDAASTDNLKQLKDRARKVKAAASSARSAAQREEHIRRTRYLRTWNDDDGALRLDAKLPVAEGAQVLATLEARARASFEDARAEGRKESESAYLADALVALCSEGAAIDAGGSSRPVPSVQLRVDLAALRAGELVSGQTCEIPGVGPVSLATARALLGDCFLTLFVTDGVDVQSIVHYGRTVKAPVRRALTVRDPYCVVPGCGATRFLEIDHWRVDFADGGPTSLDNLCRLCPHHHRLKTVGAYELLGGPGKWEFRPVRDPSRGPPDPDELHFVAQAACEGDGGDANLFDGL